MKLPKKLLLGAILFLIAALGVHTVMKRRAAPAAVPAAQQAPAVIELLSSDTLEVGPVELRRTLPLTGTLRPLNQAVVRAKVPGEVRAVLVREGEAVRAGQLVARIDPQESGARVDQNAAALAQARAQLEIVQRNYDNNRALVDKGFVSQSALETSAGNLRAAQAAVAAADAQVRLARKSLNDTEVRAPISGVVSERSAQPGEKVSTDGKLLVIIDPSMLEIEALVPVADMPAVRVGQRARLRVDGLTDDIAARIVRINPGTAAGSRSVAVYLQLDRPGAARAGMFVRGELVLAARGGVLAVPRAALLDVDGERGELMVIDGERLQRRAVTLGEHSGDGQEALIEIVAGLASGSRIVQVNPASYRPGTAVRIAAPAVAGTAAASAAAGN